MNCASNRSLSWPLLSRQGRLDPADGLSLCGRPCHYVQIAVNGSSDNESTSSVLVRWTGSIGAETTFDYPSSHYGTIWHDTRKSNSISKLAESGIRLCIA